MKQIVYLLILSLISVGVFAQEETQSTETKTIGKKQIPVSEYMPKAGDIAIGVDALPYLEYLGNMFNGTSDNTINLGASTIYGKYFLNSDAAIRAELYINKTTSVNYAYVVDDANVALNPNAQVEDKRVTKNNDVGVGLGYQLYRGYGKLRGTYGALMTYYMGKNTTEYTWGNTMNAINTTPTSTNWYGAGTNPAERNLNVKNDGYQSVGLGVFAGVEYFFLPKICIGGELGINYYYSWNAQEHYTYETLEQGEVREYDQATYAGSNYGSLRTNVYNTDNFAGRLYILFHF